MLLRRYTEALTVAKETNLDNGKLKHNSEIMAITFHGCDITFLTCVCSLIAGQNVCLRYREMKGNYLATLGAHAEHDFLNCRLEHILGLPAMPG
jgi:hypothetical protein